jgi:hypothetical protein
LIDLRREFSAFVVKSMNFAIKKGIAHDKDTNEMLVFIAAEVLGCSVISNDLQVCRDYLEGSRYLNSSS